MVVKAGYKKTEIGIIPEDWEVKKSGEIISFVIDNRSSEKISLTAIISKSLITEFFFFAFLTKEPQTRTDLTPSISDIFLAILFILASTVIIVGIDFLYHECPMVL